MTGEDGRPFRLGNRETCDDDPTVSDPKHHDGDEVYSREITVAQVRETPDAGHVEVLFLESARIYRLEKENPAFEEALGLLRAASAGGGRVRVDLASIDAEVIESIAAVGAD